MTELSIEERVALYPNFRNWFWGKLDDYRAISTKHMVDGKMTNIDQIYPWSERETLKNLGELIVGIDRGFQIVFPLFNEEGCQNPHQELLGKNCQYSQVIEEWKDICLWLREVFSADLDTRGFDFVKELRRQYFVARNLI